MVDCKINTEKSLEFYYTNNIKQRENEIKKIPIEAKNKPKAGINSTATKGRRQGNQCVFVVILLLLFWLSSKTTWHVAQASLRTLRKSY